MRAYVASPDEKWGLRLVEVGEPKIAKPDQAIVEVAFSAINRGEVSRVAAWKPGRVLGWDLSGRVVHSAPDGSGPPAGTPVFGWTDGTGSWAERVAVSTRTIEPLPEGLSLKAAAAIGVAGVTALYAVRRGGSLLGRHVIVTGAAGGVGRLAVQLARLSGAEVTAIVGPSSDRTDAVRSLEDSNVGMEHALDPNGRRAHLIVESVGGESLTAALRRVSHGGVVVTLGRSADSDGEVPAEWFYRVARLEGLNFSQDAYLDAAKPSALAVLGELAARGDLEVGIGWEGSWERLPAAAEALLARKVPGRAVIQVR